ncbi:MAG: hypothetical protein WC556_09185 [Candidatus Methanoperedens sp.]
MQLFKDVAHVLHLSTEKLEIESIRTFLEKELRNIEADIYKIGAKHGIKSIFELDEKLKIGSIKEEDMIEDFMELDYLESRRDEMLKAMEKINWQKSLS